MLALLFSLFVMAGLAALAWASYVKSAIALVLGRGGIWLRYSISLGPVRFLEYQLRMMPGRKPRAWIRKLWGRLKPVGIEEVNKSLADKNLKPFQIPLRGILDIGVHIMIEELDVRASLGVESDAAATALLCGFAITALQALKAVGARGGTVPAGMIVVRPVFNQARLSARFKCILAIKASHIIREVIEGYARRKRDGQSSD